MKHIVVEREMGAWIRHVPIILHRVLGRRVRFDEHEPAYVTAINQRVTDNIRRSKREYTRSVHRVHENRSPPAVFSFGT